MRWVFFIYFDNNLQQINLHVNKQQRGCVCVLIITRGADWPRFLLLEHMQAQMLRLERHSITTPNEVVSVWMEWWIIFYRWFVWGWRQAVRYALWAGANDAVMAVTVFSCGDKETIVCALCCDNRPCCRANGTTLDPQPTHTGGRGGGYFCNGKKMARYVLAPSLLTEPFVLESLLSMKMFSCAPRWA